MAIYHRELGRVCVCKEEDVREKSGAVVAGSSTSCRSLSSRGKKNVSHDKFPLWVKCRCSTCMKGSTKRSPVEGTPRFPTSAKNSSLG